MSSSGPTTTVLLMMNNYFHDFAVAVLISNLVLFLAFARGLRGPLALSDDQRAYVYGVAKWVTYLALAWIVVGGAIRTINYKTFEWVEAAGKGQLFALGVKHMVMGGAVFVALWLQWKLSREHGRDRVQAEPAD
jgi:hypothetical protein